MRGFKRWSLLALVIVQILCMNTMSVLAAKETNEEVEVSLSTNKSEYEQGEEIELFLNVTNCGKKDIENVLIETVVPSQYVITEGYDYEETMDVLEVGKSVQLSLKYAEKIQVPEVTITPEATSMPETTTVPEATMAPESTIAPDATAAPENTQTPTSTIVPENTAVPNHTNAPVSTIAPQPTAAPQVTSVPASSETTIDADNIQEVEVMLPNSSTSPETGDESQGNNWWVMTIILVWLLGILGVIKSKKVQKYLSLFLCITVIITSINVSKVQAEEVQTNVARKSVTVTESVIIAGKEQEVSVVVSYDSVQEVSYYNFAIEGLNEEDSIVTLEDTIDLQGTIESNQIVTSVKCVIYSDVYAEKKEIIATGTESWVVESLALELGNNYITLTAYDEKGGCGSRTIKVVRNQETTGSIVVDNVNEHNCVEMLNNTFEITGTASANKEIVSISCTFNSAANEEIRSAKAEGTTEWKFSNIPLDIGTNYLTIMAMCVDGSVFTTEVNAVRYSSEIKLADNVVPINPNIEEEYIEIQQIYDQIIDVWTEDFDTEDTSDDELCLAMYESNPLYQKVLSGAIKEGDVIYIPENEFFLTGFTVTYLYADDNYVGEVEGYEASICQVMHVTGAGYADLFNNEQDICISAVEIDEENPIAFVYFPYAVEEMNLYAMQTMTLADAGGDEPQSTEVPEETDEDIVEGRKFQYQNISPEKIKVTFEGELLSKYGLKVELDELVIFDFDGKGSTKNDRLSLSGEIGLEDINATIGLEMHPEFLSLESVIIPKQVTAILDYTKKNEIKVSYGGSVELKELIKYYKLGFDNKAEVKLFGQDVELEGVDTSGRIYLASVGINLVTMTGCYIKDLGKQVEPMVVINLYEMLDGSIEAEAYLSIETETYYKSGFNFQQTEFEGKLGSIVENRGTTNIPITIPKLSVLGKESEYELNIYDMKCKSKEEPTQVPGWSINTGIEGKASLDSGLGIGIGTMICGIIPASFDANISIGNSLSGKGSVKLSNSGKEENYRFDCLGEKIYSTLEGEYEFYSRLALTAKPDFKLAICMDDRLTADITLPKVTLLDYTLFESGLSAKKLEGVVYDSLTKFPISDAEVILKKKNSTGLGNKYKVTTDEKGGFVLSNILVIDDAVFELEITKQDYEAIIIEMSADDIGGDVTEHYMVCTSKHPYVNGTVSIADEVDGAEEGLSLATVKYEGISSTETEGISVSAETDSEGVFTIGYLPAGKYKVTVSRVGYRTKTIMVMLIAGESGKADYMLEKESVRLNGYVYYISKDGERSFVKNATVKLTRTVGSTEETYTGKTDSEGYFEFAEVLASNGNLQQDFNRYTLTVRAKGFQTFEDKVVLNKDIEKEICLEESTSVEEGIEGTIKGNMVSSQTGKVIPKIFSFYIYEGYDNTEGDVLKEYSSNEDGSFEIVMPEGEYTVKIVTASEPKIYKDVTFNITVEGDCIKEQDIEVVVYYGEKLNGGACGKTSKDDVTWAVYDLDADGIEDVLVISGSGEMEDYHNSFGVTTATPWTFLNAKYLIIEEGIVSIGSAAFMEWSIAEGTRLGGELCIPKSVTSIGEGAFYRAGFDGGLHIPDSVTDIGRMAFAYCEDFTGLYISNSVSVINESTFEGCTNITGELRLSDNGVSIGDSAFKNCKGFVGNLIIPSSATSIGESAFEGCSGLDGDLIIPSTVINWGKAVFKNCSGFDGKLVIPNSMADIKDSMFAGCSGLSGTLEIPNSVLNIGKSAFSDCRGFSGELIIPSNITSLSDEVFRGCSGFSGKLNIPNTITSIGDYAFSECTGFSGELNIPNTITSIGDYVFSGCTGFSGDLIIPNSVTSMGEGVFYICSGFNGKLVIPSSVTVLPMRAFCGCNGLTGELIIPESITSIEEEAFARCSGLTGKLIIPESVTNIGKKAFSHCTSFLGDLIIPDSVTEIGSGAFRSCLGFNGKLVLSNSITGIAANSFEECSRLTGELIIPESVTRIGAFAFSGCSSLSGNLIIPESVTEINTAAFHGCHSITGDLTIPSAVSYIGESAFGNCRCLDSITILNDVCDIDGKEVFTNVKKLAGHAGSTVEQYATQYGFEFAIIE